MRLGESYRAIWVRKHMVNASLTLGYWMAERGTDLIILFVLLFGSLYVSDGFGGAPVNLLTLILLALTLAGYLTLWVASGAVKTVMQNLRLPAGVVQIIDGFQYMQNLKVHFIVVTSTVIIWAFMTAGFYLAFQAWGITGADLLPFSILSVALVNLTGVISISPGNVGSFQAAIVLGASLFKIDAADVIVPSVFVHLTGLGIISILALSAFGMTLVSARQTKPI